MNELFIKLFLLDDLLFNYGDVFLSEYRLILDKSILLKFGLNLYFLSYSVY